MPNHVTTRCTVTGPKEDVAAFREQMFGKEEDGTPCFDFERLIPSSPIIHQVEESSFSEYGMKIIILRGERGAPFEDLGIPEMVKKMRDELGMPDAPIYKVAAAYLAKHPRYEKAGQLRLQSMAETGYGSWYSWNVANWGTKWNSYSCSVENEYPFEFRFDTAWSFPMPIFKKLETEYPTLQFKCVTFDEGWNFGGQGCFNPLYDGSLYESCDATEELYEQVYGEKHKPFEEDEC